MDKFLSILTLNHSTGLDFNTRSSGGGGDISLASVGLVADRPTAGSWCLALHERDTAHMGPRGDGQQAVGMLSIGGGMTGNGRSGVGARKLAGRQAGPGSGATGGYGD